jgi:pimeloyl-ACP methyl ester carboxylesterase
LLLSGFGATSRILDPIVNMLAIEFTCITFDYRGIGRSARRRCLATTGDLAAEAAAVLDHLRVDRAHVYGISLGGMVAQEFAIRYPHRVEGLVLAATTPGGWRAVPATPAGLRASSPPLRETPMSWLGHSGWGSLLLGWAASTHDGGVRLRRIEVPTLILHGGRDVMVPKRNAELLAARIPSAQLRILPGLGHVDLITDRFALDMVADWLKRLPAQDRVFARSGFELCDLFSALTKPALPIWHTWRTALRAKFP